MKPIKLSKKHCKRLKKLGIKRSSKDALTKSMQKEMARYEEECQIAYQKLWDGIYKDYELGGTETYKTVTKYESGKSVVYLEVDNESTE